jgi:hypothetical protein
MRGLSRHDPYGEFLAIGAIAACPTLEEAKGVMAYSGYEVSMRALESVQRNHGPEIEESRQRLALQQRERERTLFEELSAIAQQSAIEHIRSDRLAESQD